MVMDGFLVLLDVIASVYIVGKVIERFGCKQPDPWKWFDTLILIVLVGLLLRQPGCRKAMHKDCDDPYIYHGRDI